MVSVSFESPEQIDARLRLVMTRARLEILGGHYSFEEFPSNRFAARVNQQALALVRDGELWSQLTPHQGGDGEIFGVFSFHFAPDLDNSGFVGWLASHLKTTFGSGVLVVCGMNTADGGVFDYWGCPASIADDVFSEVRRLQRGG